jgi:hypothetical protein
LSHLTYSRITEYAGSKKHWNISGSADDLERVIKLYLDSPKREDKSPAG